MSSTPILALRAFGAFLLCLGIFSSSIHGQQKPSPGEEAGDGLRVNTELVQTNVTVFDKQGRFVEGLRPERFELRVDGKPQAISFFDRVTAGSTTEETQISSFGRRKSSVPEKREQSSATEQIGFEID